MQWAASFLFVAWGTCGPHERQLCLQELAAASVWGRMATVRDDLQAFIGMDVLAPPRFTAFLERFPDYRHIVCRFAPIILGNSDTFKRCHQAFLEPHKFLGSFTTLADEAG